MPPFRLNIAKPCSEDWNSMQGSDKQRHCSSCAHDVVALAEMTPEDAVALVRKARPHSLCLRIEHDEDGAVIFRQNASRMPSTPLLMLSIGASMLLTACGDSARQEVPKQSVDHVQTAHAEPAPPVREANGAAETNEKPIAAHVQPVASATASALVGAPEPSAKRLSKPTTRVTTGCACAVGDTLCDCL